MSYNITTFNVTSLQTNDEASGGLIIVRAHIFHNFITIPMVRTFRFHLNDFIFEEVSDDKHQFFLALRDEGVGCLDALHIIRSLVFLAGNLISQPGYTVLDNITLNASLHVSAVYPIISEEQFIQESFDLAPVQQTPASDVIIDSLERTNFSSDFGESSQRSDLECTICLESFVLDQKLIKMPCRHSFCEGCLISWLKVNGVCPVCRFYIS